MKLLPVEAPTAHLFELPRHPWTIAHGIEAGDAQGIDQDRRAFDDVEPDVDAAGSVRGDQRVDLRLVEAALPVEETQPNDVALELDAIQAPLRAEEESHSSPEARRRRRDGRLELGVPERAVPAKLDVVDANVARVALEVLRTGHGRQSQEQRDR